MIIRSMRIWLPAMAVVLAVSILFSGGCASDSASSGGSSAQADKPAPEIAPKVGMTKQEIITMYQGEPDYKDIAADGGEVWKYHMNAGAAWIPYNFGYHPEFDTIMFDKDGKVKQFVLSH